MNDAMRFFWLYLFLQYNLNQSVQEKTRKGFVLQEFLTWDSYFENFFEWSNPLWPETCQHNFLFAAYFSVRPSDKRCQLLLLQEKIGLYFPLK